MNGIKLSKTKMIQLTINITAHKNTMLHELITVSWTGTVTEKYRYVAKTSYIIGISYSFPVDDTGKIYLISFSSVKSNKQQI